MLQHEGWLQNQGQRKAWEGFKKQQLNWAPEMKQVVDELVQRIRQQPEVVPGSVRRFALLAAAPAL